MPKFLRESWKAILQNRPCLTFELPECLLLFFHKNKIYQWKADKILNDVGIFKNCLRARKTSQEPFKIWLLQRLNDKVPHQRCLTFCITTEQPTNAQEKWKQICNSDIVEHLINEFDFYFWITLMPKMWCESSSEIFENRLCPTFELPEC